MNEDRKSGNIVTLGTLSADGETGYLDVSGNRYQTFQIVASAVTTGANANIDVSLDGTNWAAISTTAVSGNGSTIVSKTAAYKYVRGSVDTRTDGTYKFMVVLDK